MWTAAIGSLRSENEVAVRSFHEICKYESRCCIITCVKLYSGILLAKLELNPPWEVKEECGRGLDVFGRTSL